MTLVHMGFNGDQTLESPLDYKEIQPVHSEGNQPWVPLEGMMLKLKLQYFGHLMRRVDSLGLGDYGYLRRELAHELSADAARKSLFLAR